MAACGHCEGDGWAPDVTGRYRRCWFCAKREEIEQAEEHLAELKKELRQAALAN